MAEYLVQGESLSQIADAVRASTGSTDPLTLDEMAAVISQMSAGGGSELVIVGGITRPANPNQNTIWIDTDAEITSYVLSATEPANPVEGMAWVTIGDSGTSKIVSPVGGDWITVYPLNASQYINGEWVGVVARSYQDGKWVDWITFLYKAGDECKDITGGWQGRAWASVAGDGHYADAFALTRHETYMHCSLGQNRTGVVEIKNDISFKGKKKLNLECSNVVNINTSIGLRMAIINRNASYWFTNADSIVSIGNGINYITLENYQNDNTYDVIICAVTNEGSAEASFDMLNAWLE